MQAQQSVTGFSKQSGACWDRPGATVRGETEAIWSSLTHGYTKLQFMIGILPVIPAHKRASLWARSRVALTTSAHIPLENVPLKSQGHTLTVRETRMKHI